MGKNLRPTWCGLCHARCGLWLEFCGQRATAVRGDPDHLFNQRRTCKRGRMILDHLYHPERLNYPLRRVAERGTNQWQQISWAVVLANRPLAHRLRFRGDVFTVAPWKSATACCYGQRTTPGPTTAYTGRLAS